MRILTMFLMLTVFFIMLVPMAHADDITNLQRSIIAQGNALKVLREDIKNSNLPQAQKDVFYKSLNTLDKHTLERAKGILNAIIASKNAHDPALFDTLFAQTEAYYNKLIKERDEFEVKKITGEKLSTKLIEQNHKELERVEYKLGALKNIKRNGASAIEPLIKEAMDYKDVFNPEIKKFRESFNSISAKLKSAVLPSSLIENSPTPQTTDKMKRYLAERAEKGPKNLFPIDSNGFPIEAAVLDHALANKPAVPALLKNTESAKILSFAKGAGKVVGAVGVVTVAYDIAVENNAEYALTKYMESMKKCRTLQNPSVIIALWGRIKQIGVTIGIHTGMDDIAALLSDGITKGNFSDDVKKELRDGINYIKKNCPEIFAALKADARFIDGLNDMDARTAVNPLVLELKQGPLYWWQRMAVPRSTLYNHPYDIRPFEGVSTP